MALALALDRAAGAAPAAALGRAAVGLGCFLLLLVAARRGGRLYSVLWLLAVVGVPLLAAVVGWDGRPGGTPAWLAAAARPSPLEWLWAAARPGSTPAHALQPLVLCAGLLALGLGRRQGAAVGGPVSAPVGPGEQPSGDGP